MKSSQIFTAIVAAAILAVIGFFLANMFDANQQTVAVSIFIGALVSPFLSQLFNSNSSEQSSDIKTLYVGNLPYRANEAAVRNLFSEHGTVHSVRLMKDKHTGKRRGFGFVEMASADFENAISALNDSEFQQRTLKVREAKERPERTDDSE
ncbi:RNA recognition motif domain-containing protein [Thalassotalea atypica]|uniref:RNA recognition motif domain-containing protein n=1 Tax=Thalassotalea atypica TaxID=2054316 RepID=UPI0025745CA4|nr:RNA-binding protein [Thalassotalea atypica]